MKIEEWMVSEGYLDDKQYEIYMTDPDKSLIVAGNAGSGKTVLAVHRAKKMSVLGSFVLLVYNKALKSMIEFGFKAQKLPSDSAIYAWAWENRGMDLSGLVFFPKSKINGKDSYNEGKIYLQKSDMNCQPILGNLILTNYMKHIYKLAINSHKRKFNQSKRK